MRNRTILLASLPLVIALILPGCASKRISGEVGPDGTFRVVLEDSNPVPFAPTDSVSPSVPLPSVDEENLQLDVGQVQVRIQFASVDEEMHDDGEGLDWWKYQMKRLVRVLEQLFSDDVTDSERDALWDELGEAAADFKRHLR